MSDNFLEVELAFSPLREIIHILNHKKKTNYLCRCLEDRETESHLMSGKCKFYKDIREKYDNFSSDEDLVNYFREVLDRRDEMDKELDKED